MDGIKAVPGLDAAALTAILSSKSKQFDQYSHPADALSRMTLSSDQDLAVQKYLEDVELTRTLQAAQNKALMEQEWNTQVMKDQTDRYKSDSTTFTNGGATPGGANTFGLTAEQALMMNLGTAKKHALGGDKVVSEIFENNASGASSRANAAKTVIDAGLIPQGTKESLMGLTNPDVERIFQMGNRPDAVNANTAANAQVNAAKAGRQQTFFGQIPGQPQGTYGQLRNIQENTEKFTNKGGGVGYDPNMQPGGQQQPPSREQIIMQIEADPGAKGRKFESIDENGIITWTDGTRSQWE